MQLVTILIPNYKTLELTKLCLRLIRKNTDINKIKVIVIDNDSNDASLDYLRSLRWIQLIERKDIAHESAVLSHSKALDLALQQVNTPYVLSIHTDTLIKHHKWLDFLLQQIEPDKNIAGVGSWKLESKPVWRVWLKQAERMMQTIWYSVTGRTQHGLEGVGKNYYYLRSHCALYRTELLKKYNLHFSDGDMVAGKYLHQQLVDAGHKMIFITSERLLPYLDHINHATTVLNPHLSTRQKSVIKGRRRIERNLKLLSADKILNDVSLDG